MLPFHVSIDILFAEEKASRTLIKSFLSSFRAIQNHLSTLDERNDAINRIVESSTRSCETWLGIFTEPLRKRRVVEDKPSQELSTRPISKNNHMARQLPREILEKIIESLIEITQDPAPFRNAINCARVDRKWADVAMSLVYRDVMVQNTSEIVHFMMLCKKKPYWNTESSYGAYARR